MSKKLIYIRLVIATICLLFVCFFIFLFSSIQKTIKVDSVVEETTKEEKIIFDFSKTPKQQKKEIYSHPKEYFKQLYNYTFQDEKFSNCFSYDFFYVYEIVDYYEDTENLVSVLKKFQYSALANILFDGYRKERKNEAKTLISLDDLPVTENYKEKHPKPLYEEFDFIKKENYKHPKVYHGDYMDYWYDFFYTYGVGVNEEKKEICVGEEKDVSKTFIEDDDDIERLAVARDKDGNEVLAIETRNIYFKYTTDEKGYVDDIIYDRTEIITYDKYLDNIIKYE